MCNLSQATFAGRSGSWLEDGLSKTRYNRNCSAIGQIGLENNWRLAPKPSASGSGTTSLSDRSAAQGLFDYRVAWDLSVEQAARGDTLTLKRVWLAGRPPTRLSYHYRPQFSHLREKSLPHDLCINQIDSGFLFGAFFQ